jgi:hypothetical protein
MNHQLTRKKPRDFVHIDELWDADDLWPQYFIQQSVWIYSDEYRAELTGDEDYIRIVIHSGTNQGWLFSRRLEDKKTVEKVLNKITIPISEKQLKDLGFVIWKGN